MATRVAIFVDGANMFYAQRDNGWRIEYKKIFQHFTTNRELAFALEDCGHTVKIFNISSDDGLDALLPDN